MTVPSDDDVLRELGHMLRDEEHDKDQRAFGALARGELPSEERAALEQRAARDPKLRRALAAYSPLDDRVKQRITDAILGARERSERRGTAVVAQLDPRRRSRLPDRMRAVWWALPLAAAAAVLIWLAAPASAPPLPEYALRLEGGEAALRGSEQPAAEPTQIGPETQMIVWLRPQTAVQGPVAARAFWARGSDVRSWPLAVQAAESGALRLQLAAPARGLSGRAQLVVWIGRAASAAQPDAELVAAAPSRSAVHQSWSLPITLREAPR